MSSENPTPNNTESESDAQVLIQRPRRLRRTPALRRMVQETQLTVDDLIYPMFVMEGEDQKVEISSMPGCYRYTL
ncbi:MAG: porphobilinogen synthase, partial [Mastigocoleus sp. MO_167.B18]|nr:porphobilinogen synthase [Mastigocoleus sp. MO_167.B18]